MAAKKGEDPKSPEGLKLKSELDDAAQDYLDA